MFTNLQELIATMPDEKTCREYLEKQIWNGKPVCPFCNHEKAYKLNDGKTYKCASRTCYKKFTVTVGTVFEASNVPLNKWLFAVYMATAHKKGISSLQLGRDISVTQRTAWFMLHRIREFMRVKYQMTLDNIVEIDETYVGGIVGNMSKTKRTKLREEGNTLKTKTMVMGMIERGGNLKLIALGKDNGTNILQPVVRDNVDKDAVLITDGLQSYQGLGNEYAGHEVVNHSEREYVRDKTIHTNSIEGAFSMLKRSIIGIYHQVTPKHLSRYCDETMYRYNSRKIKDHERFNFSLTQLKGRLTYKNLIKKNEVLTISEVATPKYKRRTILQFKGGELVAQYPTIGEAVRMTGLKQGSIWKVLHGRKNTTGGFEWKYA